MSRPKQRTKGPSREDALSGKPVRHDGVTETFTKKGEVLLSYTLTVKPLFAGLVRRFVKRDEQVLTKKIQLDTLGTQVWNLIDGQRSVRHIIDEFAKTNQLHPQEAEISVTQFLRSLGKKGLLGVK